MPQRFLHSILFFLSSPSKDGHTPTVALLRYYDGRGPRRDGDAGAIKELRTEERGRQGRKKVRVSISHMIKQNRKTARQARSRCWGVKVKAD